MTTNATNVPKEPREREPEVRKCRYCGAGKNLIESVTGRLSCFNMVNCRDRCASALAEQAAQLAEERVEVEVWRDAVSAITAILTNIKSEVAALREMLGEYREELRLDVANCHCDRVGRESCCSMCRANMSQIDRIDALLATKPGSAHKEEE